MPWVVVCLVRLVDGVRPGGCRRVGRLRVFSALGVVCGVTGQKGLGCGDDAVKNVGNGGWGHRVVKYHYLVDGRPDEEGSPAVWGGCR